MGPFRRQRVRPEGPISLVIGALVLAWFLFFFLFGTADMFVETLNTWSFHKSFTTSAWYMVWLLLALVAGLFAWMVQLGK
jgi:hypothetical protein